MQLHLSYDFSPIQAYKFGSSFYGKPAMFVYVYLIDGLLIDTGHSNMRKKIVEILAPLPVEQMFITHHHEDHNGNLNALQAHYNCPAYASPLCADILKKPPRISPVQWFTWGQTEATDQLIPIRDAISTPNYTFQIIPIPGHAIDQVALYEPNEGWLFSADLYIFDYIRYCMDNESLGDQIQSIKKVLQLDFDKLFCCHNPQLKNPKDRLRAKLHFLEDFYGKVAALHHQGVSASAIATQLSLKKNWRVRLFSLGKLSALNMVRSVIRDERHIG